MKPRHIMILTKISHGLIFADRGKIRTLWRQFLEDLLKKRRICLKNVSHCIDIKKYLYHIMFIRRGYTASKSKFIKYDIKTCLFRERKNVSINYVCVMHELLNVFYERSIGFF